MKFAGIAAVLLLLLAPVSGHAADATHGEALVRAYCVPCHGFPPSGGPEFGANNPQRITNAINSVVPAMSVLRTLLTPADIADIAAYLGVLYAPPPSTTITPAFDFSDLWFNPAESGWGLNLVQHASANIFGVMYTYEAPNRPLWLVIPGGTWTTSMQFTGAIFRVTGPLASAFDPTKVNVRQVGTATLSFADHDNGVLTFTIDGATVTKTISRQPF